MKRKAAQYSLTIVVPTAIVTMLLKALGWA